MKTILQEKYGLECPMLDMRYKGRIGLEDLESELEANDELEDEVPEQVDSDWNEGIDGEDIPDNSDLVVDEEGTDVEDNPENPDDISDDYYSSDDVENDFNNIEGGVEDLPSDADCINMVEIISNYANTYVANMELFYKTNPDSLDLTGDFKKSKMFKFVDDAIATINAVYNEDEELVKTVNNLFNIAKDIPKMKTICGNETTPFIYEGIQLLLIELSRTLLALLPFHLKENQPIDAIIAEMGLKVPSMLIEMANDIVEVSGLFGTRIFFVAPVESEITGKSEEIAETPYITIKDEISRPEDSMSPMNYSGESIMNLIQIKNNKALPEYSLICKALGILSGIMRDIDLEKSCKELVDGIKEILVQEAGEESIDKYCDEFRSMILMPQIDAFNSVQVAEQKKLSENN
jgi:hypothetical protein